jgi:hypothetical protein
MTCCTIIEESLRLVGKPISMTPKIALIASISDATVHEFIRTPHTYICFRPKLILDSRPVVDAPCVISEFCFCPQTLRQKCYQLQVNAEFDLQTLSDDLRFHER